jgi:Cu/Ag efflux protein CusF
MEQIYSGENDSGKMTEVQAGQFPTTESVPSKPVPTEQRRITARAVVRGVDQESLKVKLQHEPITELKWPAMTMNFAVDADVPLGELENGQDIHFSMSEDPEGNWLIDQIHVMSAAIKSEDSSDD